MTDAASHPGLFDSPGFEPTLAAAQARIAAVRPGDYARTRNALDGAVTRLSPYITHGFVTLSDVWTGVRQRHRIDAGHKFVYELGWRAFFRHVWHHRGDAIFRSLHEGILPDSAYNPVLPADIRQGATGIPVIDQAVRALYATGYLHNHARMWLASYVVHLRKVHWRAGADWLYAHLLDGDLASNHLSWQWVAATGSSKPYLFNAENVARYAPRDWQSAGTVIDRSYEELEAIARSTRAVPAGPSGTPSVQEPALFRQPPPGLAISREVPDAAPLGCWLVHPFALRAGLPAKSGIDGEPGTPVLAAYLAEFHACWPWNARRWHFVHQAMTQFGGTPWWASAAAWSALAGKARTFDDPHLRPFGLLHDAMAPPQLFAEPGRICQSFSQFYRQVADSLPPA
jgi:deoxyribodipyrimidine photo-lyase